MTFTYPRSCAACLGDVVGMKPLATSSRKRTRSLAQAQVRVLQAKAEADSMQYTLPLKQKQIEQSKLEAQARKEARGGPGGRSTPSRCAKALRPSALGLSSEHG